jgi:hypothetical protein
MAALMERKLPDYRARLNAVLDEHNLTEPQTIVYAAIFHAAEVGLPCPKGEELNDLLGFSSDSASRFTIARLEAMGLIRAERFQRFRKVLVIASGKWTAADPSQQSENRHVPRGAKLRTVIPGVIEATGAVYRTPKRSR